MSFFVLVYAVCLAGAVVTALVAAWSDVRSMTIPNAYSVVMIALFCVGYGALVLAGGGVDPWWSHLSAMLIVFVVTLVMFMVNAIGAGDSKFGAACALWVGLTGLVPFLLVMMIVGMVLAVAALMLRGRTVWAQAAPDSWVGQVQGGVSAIPYGVAITCGLCAVLPGAGLIEPLMAFFH